MIRFIVYTSARVNTVQVQQLDLAKRIQPIKVTVVISDLMTEVAEYREKGPT
jgi:hypothetical protein